MRLATGKSNRLQAIGIWCAVFTYQTYSWILAAVVLAGRILLSQPLIALGVDPIAASAGRVAIAAVALVIVYEFFSRGI